MKNISNNKKILTIGVDIVIPIYAKVSSGGCGVTGTVNIFYSTSNDSNMNNAIPLANENPFFLGQYCCCNKENSQNVPVKTDGNFKSIFMAPNTCIYIICSIKIIKSGSTSTIYITNNYLASAYIGSVNFFNYVDG